MATAPGNASAVTLAEVEVLKKELRRTKNLPELFKSYFDDPTLSDITIKLSDRSVHLHQIVLCRRSEYFSTFLATKNFKEGDSKEVELHENDPEAMMAVLRYLYGLPYAADLAEWHDGATLLPHVLVYTTAEKYQITGLKIESCVTMCDIVRSYSNHSDRARAWLGSSDHLDSLHLIHAGTPTSDTGGRDLLVTYCVDRLHFLSNNDAFMQLVADVPGLGAQLIAHKYNGKDHDSDEEYIPDVAADEEYCELCEKMTRFACVECVPQAAG